MVIKSVDTAHGGVALKFTLNFLSDASFNGTDYIIDEVVVSNGYNSSNGKII